VGHIRNICQRRPCPSNTGQGMNSGDLLHYGQIRARKFFVVLAPGLKCIRSQLTSLLVTRPISNLSGKSIVLAMASTIRRDADFVGQSSKL